MTSCYIKVVCPTDCGASPTTAAIITIFPKMGIRLFLLRSNVEYLYRIPAPLPWRGDFRFIFSERFRRNRRNTIVLKFKNEIQCNAPGVVLYMNDGCKQWYNRLKVKRETYTRNKFVELSARTQVVMNNFKNFSTPKRSASIDEITYKTTNWVVCALNYSFYVRRNIPVPTGRKQRKRTRRKKIRRSNGLFSSDFGKH